MAVFDDPAYDGHERVVFASDPGADLRAIIAIHDTSLGPAAGGCRMWPYASEVEALSDVLRLSRAMSYKNALAGLPLGGGKTVVIAAPGSPGREARLLSLAAQIELLGGAYWTAEDVGVGADDVEILARGTRYVFGRTRGASRTGDPSPFTARGVFAGIRAAVAHRRGRPHLRGLRVAVQGVGHVGRALCELLAGAGAQLTAADPDEAALAAVVDALGAQAESPEAIHRAEADVFAPCALGAALDDTTIPELRAEIVAGAANNQLAEPRHGAALHARGILYAPDYVINAGGMINGAGDILGHYDEALVCERVDRIYDTATALFERARREDRPPADVADDEARARLAAARRAGAG